MLLTSCASKNKSKGKEFSPMKAKSSLVKGKTTKAEVIKLFGSPEMVNFDSNGSEQWVYSKSSTEWEDSYSEVDVLAADFVSDTLVAGLPSFGSSESSRSDKTRTLEVYFNKKGLLDYYEFSTNTL